MWSKRVGETSDALGFAGGLFLGTPQEIARELAEAARNRKHHKGVEGKKRSTAKSDYASAMSMLCFYVNRAGSKLTAERRSALEAAKVFLRKEFGRV